MKQYRVVGIDAKDERLFHVGVDAPNQAIAWMMVLARRCAEISRLRRLLIALISLLFSFAVIEMQASSLPLDLRRLSIYLAKIIYSHLTAVLDVRRFWPRPPRGRHTSAWSGRDVSFNTIPGRVVGRKRLWSGRGIALLQFADCVDESRARP
jgi:hypothetical protein